MRLKAYHLSFETHLKSLSSNTFSIFYSTLILQSFIFWMTWHSVNLRDKHNFQNFSNFVNCPLPPNRHSYSSWHRTAKIDPIGMIQNALESWSNRLSNVRRIKLIWYVVMTLSRFFKNHSFNFSPSWYDHMSPFRWLAP